MRRRKLSQDSIFLEILKNSSKKIKLLFQDRPDLQNTTYLIGVLFRMRIAHISDLHFGGIVSTELLSALQEDLQDAHPQLLAITGDITDRGRNSQFKWARNFLASLDIPYLTVPGNREIGILAFWEWIFPSLAMRRYESYFGQSDRIIYHYTAENIVFIGLNSVHQLPAWPGRIKRDTRYWLKNLASEFPDARKVLLLHHPVMPVIRSSSYWAHILSDAGEILNICSETGISLILQGHKHRSAVMEVSLPSRNARIVVSCGGAPLSVRWDAAYHIIDISETSIEVGTREYRNQRFDETGRYEFNT
jgi:3',5'-cyclic AMP phosphodiesterase CpdA